MSHNLPGISKDFPGIKSPINKKSIPAPTFEFSVTSEEGIHLFVDMNSSLLDCRTRFENEIRTCNCFQTNRTQSFREELQYLGCKFEQRKNSFVSDTKSCTKLNCPDDENVDSSQYDIVVENGSSLLSYPEAKNEHSEILAQEKRKNCLNVSEQLEQEGENSISCCLSSVASDLVDVNSNIRGLMVGDGSESMVDDQNVMLLNKTTITDIENSGNNKPFNASSSNESVDLKAPSISSTDAPERHPSKQTTMLRTGGGCKRKRRMNEYSGRILRSAHNRQFLRGIASCSDERVCVLTPIFYGFSLWELLSGDLLLSSFMPSAFMLIVLTTVLLLLFFFTLLNSVFISQLHNFPFLDYQIMPNILKYPCYF